MTVSSESPKSPAPSDEAILKGLAPIAVAMGMPAADLLAGLRAEAEEQQRPNAPSLGERIAKLEQTVSIYGEMLDDLRNKVYALEHGTTYRRYGDED